MVPRRTGQFCKRRHPTSFFDVRKSRRLCGKSACVDSSAAVGAVDFSMMHISGHHRSQMLLLPEAVDDYVGTDNPVRFVDAFVDEVTLRRRGSAGSRRRRRSPRLRASVAPL